MRAVRSSCREVDTALATAIASKSADELDAALKQAEALRFGSPNVTAASQLLNLLVGESRVRAQLTAAVTTGTIEALQSAISAVKQLPEPSATALATDPKYVEADKLLTKLLEQNRLRSALAKALASRDESATQSILQRALSAELTDVDETIQSAQLWLKQLSDVRKRLSALIAARDAAGLAAAITTAISIGLEFDPSVSEAQQTLKGWKDASAACRAACDAQPLRTLPVLDAALERAGKSGLEEHDPDLVEATKLRASCAATDHCNQHAKCGRAVSRFEIG